MADNKNPQDDHIEDLLSQLQGIFGKLSRQEEEESKDKIEAAPTKISTPAPIAAPTPTPPVQPQAAEPPPIAGPFELNPPASVEIPEPPPVVEKEVSLNEAAPAPTPIEEPVQAPEEVAVTTNSLEGDKNLPTPPPVPALVPSPAAVPPATVSDPSQLATMIAFPMGRETEARNLATKLETITPKFTKVAFRLKVTWTASYDSKSEWKDALIAQAVEHQAKAFFIVLDRPIDDVRRKALMADAEKMAFYLQEVPLVAIEKKAFYTDVLLGLVFFMDSQKPNQPEQAA